jgi:hypothetical protein
MSLCGELGIQLGQLNLIENKQNTPVNITPISITPIHTDRDISSNQYRGRDQPPSYNIDQNGIPLRYV